MTREATKKEKEWIRKFKSCLRTMPESINMHISNEQMKFQIYDTETKELLYAEIKHGFEQGDPLNEPSNSV